MLDFDITERHIRIADTIVVWKLNVQYLSK
jgi:hypothetical protein